MSAGYLEGPGVEEIYPFLTDTWLRRQRHTGKGPSYTKVGRIVLYRREDIETYLEQCRVDPA